MFMGLRSEHVICRDLRMSNKNIVALFDQAYTAGWLKLLNSKPEMLVTKDCEGVVNVIFGKFPRISKHFTLM